MVVVFLVVRIVVFFLCLVYPEMTLCGSQDVRIDSHTNLLFFFFLCFTRRLEFRGWLTDFIPPQVRLLPFTLH